MKTIIIEHDPADIELIQHELKKGNVNYTSEIVKSENKYKKTFHNFKPFSILSNYTLPYFDGATAFKLKKKLPNLTNKVNRVLKGDILSTKTPTVVEKRLETSLNRNYSITEETSKKKKIEKASKIEKEWFSDLFLQAPSAMGIVKGPNHVYEIVNTLYLELIGKKDIIGKSVKEVRPEYVPNGLIEILDQVYKTGISFSANEVLIKLDKENNGNIVDSYTNLLYQAHRDNEGNIDGIFFFANDVTEQVVSRKKIEESENRYEELFQNLPVATYSCDAEGHIIKYNKAATALWGKEPEIGKDKWSGSYTIYDKEDNPIPLNSCPMALALKEGKVIAGEEIIIERHNGEKRNVASYPIPFIDVEGQITGAVNVLTDITENKVAQQTLKESESKLKEAQAIAHLGNWELNFETGIALWSDETCRIYGLSPKDNKQSFSSWISFIHPDDMDIVMAIVNESQRTLSNNVLKNRILLKDGTIKHIHSECRFKFDQNGKPISLFGIAHDVTELKLARLQLEQQNKVLAFQNGEKENRTIELSIANKELIKRNTELDRFVYSVSHDLRSPLTSILGLISFIEEESQETDTLEHILMIRNSINRLDEFIKNILSYSRNNRTELEIEKISLQKTTIDIVDSLHSMEDAKGIHFEINIKEQYPFYSDKLRFNTILENLVSNAIKYHQKDESDRYIKITGQSDPEKLQFSIVDNGIGIAPAHHAKIFDMFFRLSSNKDGSGIGLYIVKDTVEILQGTIQIHSEEGVGTTFSITLKNLKK